MPAPYCSLRAVLAAYAATAVAGCGGGASVRPPEVAAGAGAVRAAAPRRFVSPYGYEWFLRAELLVAEGRHAEASEAYERALSSDEDAYVLARLAEALDRSGDPASAEDALQHGLELDPHSEAVWLARGRIAERRGAMEEALDAYQRAGAAAPSSLEAARALAALLRRKGHPERADAVLARHAGPRALRATRDPRARLARAIADQDADAVEHLLVTTPPDRLGGPLRVAEAYLAIDRPEHALEQLEQASSATEAESHHRALLRARALLHAGRAAEAAVEAATIPRASAHHREAIHVLARALEAQGLPALAAEVEARTAE